MYRRLSGLRLQLVIGVLATGMSGGSPALAGEPLALESDTSIAYAGYYQLRWDVGDEDVQLVEATDPRFSDSRIVYAGPDTARLVSGKPNGRYYYRLETAAAEDSVVVSEPLVVTVKHHSLQRAFSFFGIGAVVFAATLGLIVVGGRDERG